MSGTCTNVRRRRRLEILDVEGQRAVRRGLSYSCSADVTAFFLVLCFTDTARLFDQRTVEGEIAGHSRNFQRFLHVVSRISHSPIPLHPRSVTFHALSERPSESWSQGPSAVIGMLRVSIPRIRAIAATAFSTCMFVSRATQIGAFPKPPRPDAQSRTAFAPQEGSASFKAPSTTACLEIARISFGPPL